MPLCLSSLVNVNCECYPQGNSRSRKTSLSLTRHCLSRPSRGRGRESREEQRQRGEGDGGRRRRRRRRRQTGKVKRPVSFYCHRARSLSPSVRPSRTCAAPCREFYDWRGARGRCPPPPLLAQFAPHRRFIASHDHNASGEQCMPGRPTSAFFLNPHRQSRPLSSLLSRHTERLALAFLVR